MRVLAIDPGTLKMGYGVVDAEPTPRADDYGVVALPASMPIEKRLYQLHTHILNMIHVFQPDAIAVEDPFVGRGERAFAKSALAIGQAQAVVLIGAASQGVPVHRYAPASGETGRDRLRRSDQRAGAADDSVSTLGLREMPEVGRGGRAGGGAVSHLQEPDGR